jgi:hypothetical protein
LAALPQHSLFSLAGQVCGDGLRLQPQPAAPAGTYLQIPTSYAQQEQRQWDGGVIKTAATLPGSTYSLGQVRLPAAAPRARAGAAPNHVWSGARTPVGNMKPQTPFQKLQSSNPRPPFPKRQQYTGSGTRNVELTGYPAQNTRAGMNCNNAAYSGACLQYSSRGTLSSGLSYGLYSSTNLDMCAGNSGGSVFDLNSGAVTAITIAETASPCTNYFTPIVLRANADANCVRSSGGVSLACLAAKVPASA